VFICRSYDQKRKWLFFWNTVYIGKLLRMRTRHVERSYS